MYASIGFLLFLLQAWPASTGATSLGETKQSYDFPHLSLPAAVTYRELRRAYGPSLSRLALTALRSVNFGIVPLKSQKVYYVRVQNPTSGVIAAQIVLLPNNVEELVSDGCPRKEEVVLDDEDEFDNRGHWGTRCASDDLEVPSLRELSKQDPPALLKLSPRLSLSAYIRQLFLRRDSPSNKSKHSFKASLLPKLKCGRRCSWHLPDPETNTAMLQKQSQGFFLGTAARETVIIPPGEALLLGPILFQPGAVGPYEGKVMLRTTAGAGQIIDLRGEGQYARLAFRKEAAHRYPTQRLTIQTQELQALSFDITAEDIESTALLHSSFLRLPEQIRISKVFEAENVGTIPLVVTAVLLNGGTCALMGVRVENCEQVRVVRPKETMEVTVSYDVDFWQKGAEVQLWVVTEDDTFFLPLEVSLHLDDLPQFAFLQLTSHHSPFYLLSELCTLVHLFCTIGYLVVVFREVMNKSPKQASPRLISTRRLISRKGYYVYARLQAPILHFRPQTVAVDKGETQKSVSPSNGEDIPRVDDPLKVKKIKKNKGPILKFSPMKAEPHREVDSAPHQAIFATNKLLLAKKKPKSSDAPEAVSSEKPETAKESLSLESRTTAAHSEDGEMEELDEYLDEYKTREGLFSGFSTRMGS